MNRTKDIIIDAFWQLLAEKPYNKITVKDIVDRCQINRNTFYYHFHDIPELLEDTVKRDTDEIIQSYSKFGSPMDCLTPLVQQSMKRKKAVLHIYRSEQREVFLNQLETITLFAVTQYIECVTADLSLPSDDKALFIRFFKCTLLGICLDWLDHGMNYDLLKYFTRLSELLSDSGKQAILKSAESLNNKH